MSDSLRSAGSNGGKNTAASPGSNFESLVADELRGILRSKRVSESEREALVSSVRASQGEVPWVTSTPCDAVGLALSGGGIRSATFNLGVLEGLEKHGVLDYVDYLATVSGGGYIGGWWSAYLKRAADRSSLPPKAPKPADASPPSGDRSSSDAQSSDHTPTFPTRSKAPGSVERAEIRHLREFRSYLSPQLGFSRVSTWTAWISVVRALLIGLIITLALLMVVLAVWVAILSGLDHCAWATTALIFVAVMWGAEELWARSQHSAVSKRERKTVIVTSFIVSGFVTGVATLLGRLEPLAPLVSRTVTVPWVQEDARLIALPVASSVVVGLALLLFEVFIKDRVRANCYQRVVARLFGFAAIWGVVGGLWLAGTRLASAFWNPLYLLSVSITAASAFWRVRSWINDQAAEIAKATPRTIAREVVPRLFALIATVTMIVAVTAAVQFLVSRLGQSRALLHYASIRGCAPSTLAWLALFAAALPTSIIFLLLLDPNRSGLQSFYRDRLVRTYLGASNPDIDATAAVNRAAQPQEHDDLPLETLRDRPLHLVCCTLNDTSGNSLANLSLNAWSATLSKHGMSYKDVHAKTPERTLGDALAASAAAFNPNMGFFSARLGRLTTFLIAALNLRLGLWVPLDATARHWPRWPKLFFQELFGLVDVPKPNASHGYVHLTDGGHFENLGLYELVRRHCRYIIVSDATADPDYEFVDLGNAIRRIRTDFGIDIQLDFHALVPDGDKGSPQHVVVGKVPYADGDHGLLVYIKATLSGDEPSDVVQYRANNSAFPHDSTVNQFYSEAQWEAYRRLGEHIANVAANAAKSTIPADSLHLFFGRLWKTWFPTPAGMKVSNPDLTQRWVQLHQRVLETGSLQLRRELFPELSLGAEEGGDAGKKAAPNDQHRDLQAIHEAITLFEDVWDGGAFADAWDHPLKQGWVNAVERWVLAPTVRWWWPLIKAMYSPLFTSFLERCTSMCAAKDNAVPELNLLDAPRLTPGFAQHYWNMLRSEEKADGAGAPGERICELVRPEAKGRTRLQLGIVKLRQENATVSWNERNLFLPPGLEGSGLRNEFVRLLLTKLKAEGVKRVVVTVTDGSNTSRPNAEPKIQFYRRFDFRFMTKGRDHVLELDLAPPTPAPPAATAGEAAPAEAPRA